MFDVQGVTLHFGARLVLSNASFKVEDGERAAIVGPNGTGKSTLLKVIAGHIQPESGQVSYPKSSEIGYLPQDLEVLSDCSVEDECRKVFEEVLKHEREMRELEHRMSEVPHGTPEFDVIAERYEYLLHETERRDIYTMDSEIARVLSGLGFKPEDLKRPCRTFSGGWQMRIALGKLLLQNPDILLLDEPTNHLDIESIEWLAEWIKGHRGCVLMVSHERFFMDALVTKVVEVDRANVIVYRGNYTDSLRMREERKEQMRRTYENQQLEIAHIQKFIDRFRYQASKAAMVQSRVKMLEKMEIAPSPPPDQGTINFRFPPAPRSAKEVIVVDDLAKSFGEKRVFHDVSFTLYRGEKVALVGHNGAGKTTLMKCIAGGLEQDRGKVTIGGNVDMAYFAQYDREDLHPQNTVLDEFMSSAPLSVSPLARAILGAFLFTGDDVEKKIAVLSGGERTRLRLAKMLCGKANLLLMDEPTNHLDIGSRLTLETALRQYDGAVLLVSHDRYFLNAVVTRVVEIDNGVVTSYPGNYDDYLRLKAAREAAMGAAATNGRAAARAAVQAPTPVVSADKVLADINSVPRRESKDERRRRQDAQKETQKKLTKAKKRVEELEDALYRAEEAVGAAENALARAAADRAGDKIGELNKALEKAQAQKKRIEDEWFAATQEAEELEASLSES